MSFAENKVKEHIDNNLRRFQDRVRVAQMLHLRCFTAVDREEIIAYEGRHGNSLAFWEFFQRLHVRQGWVQQFVEALRRDHLGDLAEELQEVYRRHQLQQQGSGRLAPELPPGPARGASPRRNTSAPAAPRATDEAAISSSSCSLPPPVQTAAPSPSQSLPLSSGARPPSPLPVDAPRPGTSATIPAVSDMGDCSAPVQETALPSQSSEMTVRPKAMHNAGKGEPSTPPTKATASPSKVGGEKTTDGQATSATSASSGPPAQPVEESFPSTPVVSLRPGAGSLTHRWDSGQQHATHERRGFSGSGPRVKVHGPSPPSTGAPNQPEENYYSSADSSLLASGGPEEQPGEGWLKKRKIQGLPGKRKEERLGNPVGAEASPSQLQQRFGAGEGIAVGSRGPCGDVAVEDVGEMASVDPATEGPGNFQPRGNSDVTARLSSGAPRLGSSLSVQPQLLTNPVGNGGASQMPAAAAADPVLQPVPSDWENCTSTDVIPPNSPPGSSNFVSQFTKLPIQEKKLPFGEPSGTHATLLTRKKVPSATVDWSTANFRRNRNDHIFHSNCDDDSLCKPEILMSYPEDPPVGLLGQLPSGQEGTPEYSGRTDRFRCSASFSLGSDSLQRTNSNSSRSGASGERCSNPEGGPVPGRNVRTAAALDASRQPSIGIQQENGSIRTFVHSVRQEASVDVSGAPDAMDLVGASSRPSPDVLPDSATGCQLDTGADASCGSSQPKEATSPKPSSTPSNDTLLLVGAVLLTSVAVVVFVLLKRK